jgi:hypothetical protein
MNAAATTTQAHHPGAAHQLRPTSEETMTATVTPIRPAARQHFATTGSDGWTFDAAPVTARDCGIDLEAWLRNAAPAPKWADQVELNQADGHNERAQLLVHRLNEHGETVVVKITIELEEV